MGMFDYIQYRNQEYQTKNTPNQCIDYYKIETDQNNGHSYLWLQKYDADWVESGDYITGGYLNRTNERWELCHDFSGTLMFYRSVDKEYSHWEEYTATILNGQVTNITLEYTTE